ncbi:DUF4870 domain-containing protein [Paenibacillus sp. IHBB 10380]|uniref:DUF4870 domain-containing protein n=1 Tax=Paenibacillus sp. IHBB 10380 TaxID=1566358 RepID=UPI0005CFBC87|nr:DUF4870 domain-containing protein [Paenibacillus sp. IHBB 10380]AJS57875.1 membrane protein [Paenibacillus sp. IHBB 10380]
MKGNKILSSLCYFSIFFTPFLFPLIVFFVAEEDVKYHAKKALWTHLIPYAALIAGLVASGVIGLSTQTETAMVMGIIVAYIIFAVIGVYFFVWNILKGIKLLREI